MRNYILTLCILMTIGPIASCAAQICGHWEAMPRPLGLPGVSGRVHSIVFYDGGSGNRMYVGGEFTIAREDATFIQNLAAWDGAQWTAVSPVPSPPITSMAWFDDGSGPALYTASKEVGPEPLNERLRRFRNGSWEIIPASYSILTDPEFRVFDVSGQPRLHLRWRFVESGGNSAIAAWNGTSFEIVGPNLPVAVGFEQFQGDLYATANTSGFQGLYKLVGETWEPVANAPAAARGRLTVHDDGAGPKLCIAGTGVWAFDGVTFSDISYGVGSVDYLYSWDTGQGRRLIARSGFNDRLYRLQNSAWTPYLFASGDALAVNAISAGTVGGVNRLVIGGNFAAVDGVPSSSLFATTVTIPSAITPGTIPVVTAAAMFDAGAGPQLYVSGDLSSAGGVSLNRIARFDGSSYQPLGAGLGDRATEMLVHDDGSGPALFAAGNFLTAGPHFAYSIAKWNGAAWSTLGHGLRQSSNPGTVHAMAVYDDGNGAALYVGGQFDTAGGAPAANIARWNGTAWSAVGAGLDGTVRTLAMFDDGQGPALVAGGDFTGSGAAPIARLAVYRGAGWTQFLGGANNNVCVIGAFDDGGGDALFAAGPFTNIGGVAVQRHARCRNGVWQQPDPSATVGSWSPTSPTGFGALTNVQRPFCYFYANRSFSITHAGGFTKHIAVWDGLSWTDLGNGPGGWVHTMLPVEDASDPRIIVGGEFTTPGGIESPGIALWRSCPACYANCDGSTTAPVLNIADFTCFLNRFAAEESYANCDQSTTPPVLNVADFTCFLQRFAAGCP